MLLVYILLINLLLCSLINNEEKQKLADAGNAEAFSLMNDLKNKMGFGGDQKYSEEERDKRINAYINYHDNIMSNVDFYNLDPLSDNDKIKIYNVLLGLDNTINLDT